MKYYLPGWYNGAITEWDSDKNAEPVPVMRKTPKGTALAVIKYMIEEEGLEVGGEDGDPVTIILINDDNTENSRWIVSVKIEEVDGDEKWSYKIKEIKQ